MSDDDELEEKPKPLKKTKAEKKIEELKAEKAEVEK